MIRWLSGLGLVLFFFTAVPKAEAKLVLWGVGDSIMNVRDISAETKKRIEMMNKILQVRAPGRQIPTDYKIGYKYSYFALFFLNIWTWKGQFVLYKNRRYIPLNPKRAKLYKIEMSSLGKPFLYSFPLGLLIVCGGLIVLVVMGMMGGSGGAEEEGGGAERLLERTRS